MSNTNSYIANVALAGLGGRFPIRLSVAVCSGFAVKMILTSAADQFDSIVFLKSLAGFEIYYFVCTMIFLFFLPIVVNTTAPDSITLQIRAVNALLTEAEASAEQRKYTYFSLISHYLRYSDDMRSFDFLQRATQEQIDEFKSRKQN